MEEYLKRFRPKRPRPELKDEIISLARISWPVSQKRLIITRRTSHGLAWLGVAAGIIICLGLNLYFEQVHQDRLNELFGPASQMVATKESPARKLAKELVAMLGNNGRFAWLEKRFEYQLSPPAPKMDWAMRYRMIRELTEKD